MSTTVTAPNPANTSNVLYHGKHEAIITDTNFYFDPIANSHKAWIELQVNDGKRCHGRIHKKWFNLKSDKAWTQLSNELLNFGLILTGRNHAKQTLDMAVGRGVTLSVTDSKGQKKVFIVGRA